MRAAPNLLTTALTITVLVSCATPKETLSVAGVRVFGRVHEVSVEDVRVAISAHQKDPGFSGPAEVISRDEIWRYQDEECRNHLAIYRGSGDWSVAAVVISHPIYHRAY
jgi:hypothetical protein